MICYHVMHLPNMAINEAVMEVCSYLTFQITLWLLREEAVFPGQHR